MTDGILPTALLIFNLVVWLILDWLIFRTITPKFAVIPGTEGLVGYRSYSAHTRGLIVGVVFSVIAGTVIATAVSIW